MAKDLIKFETKYRSEQIRAMQKRVDKGIFETLEHTAAAVRLTAFRLIFKRKGPSPKGTPIYSPEGKAKRPGAILFFVSDSEDFSVVGFSEGMMADSMRPHEHGGEYRGQTFPARPTMGPALEINSVRFADDFVDNLELGGSAPVGGIGNSWESFAH